MPTTKPMSEWPSYCRYWGKASKTAPDVYHLLPYHCLDVAAVAETLFATDNRLRKVFGAHLHCDEQVLNSLVGFLVGLHDLGKFSDGFQNRRPDLVARLGRNAARIRHDVRHDSLGLLAWREIAWASIRQGGGLCDHGGCDEYSWRDDALGPLVGAVMGHHGKPCEETNRAQTGLRVEDYFTRENRTAIPEFVGALVFLLPEEPKPLLLWDDEFPVAAKAISWLLAGLVVLADWIGSNEVLFRRGQDVMPLVGTKGSSRFRRLSRRFNLATRNVS